METQKTFIQLLTGELTLDMWLAYIFFMAIGVFINYLAATMNRSKKEYVAFSTSYFIRDNWRKILLTIIVALFLLRFYESVYPFFHSHLPNNYNVAELCGCAIMGFYLQKFVNYLAKKAPILKSSKEPEEFI